MADITICANNKCPIKERCYRYTAKCSPYQSYSYFESYEKDGRVACDYYMGKYVNIRMPDDATLKITFDENNVVKLESTLKVDPKTDNDGTYHEFNAAIDGMEALIISMIHNGIDIEKREILNAIIRAYSEISVRF